MLYNNCSRFSNGKYRHLIYILLLGNNVNAKEIVRSMPFTEPRLYYPLVKEKAEDILCTMNRIIEDKRRNNDYDNSYHDFVRGFHGGLSRGVILRGGSGGSGSSDNESDDDSLEEKYNEYTKTFKYYQLAFTFMENVGVKGGFFVKGYVHVKTVAR
jgi:hypothetical protein